MAASATFALKAGVWFRRGRLVIVSPDSLGTACPLSGRNSTYRPVQISGTGSLPRPPLAVKLFVQLARTLPQRGLEALGPVLTAQQHKFLSRQGVRATLRVLAISRHSTPPMRLRQHRKTPRETIRNM